MSAVPQRLSAALALLVLALAASSASAASQSCKVLDPSSNFRLSWSLTSTEVTFTLSHDNGSPGWLGLGFQNVSTSQMGPGDFITAWVTSGATGGQVFAQDRHLTADTPFGLPDMDPTQDLTVQGGSNEGNGRETVTFTRALDTGDDVYDVNLAQYGHNLTLLWAFGSMPSGSNPSYHGPNRGSFTQFNLFEASTCDPSPCPNACSGHGSCNATTKACVCDDQWMGESCDEHDLSVVKLPDGFKIEYFARGVTNARQMVQSRHNSSLLYVGTRTEGNVYAIVHDGTRAVEVVTILTGLDMPNGVEWEGGSLFVGCATSLLRFDNIDSTFRNLGKPVVLIPDIPVANGHWHAWKYLRFDSDRAKIYFGVGAPCNFCLHKDGPGNPKTDLKLPWDSVTRVNPDGTDWEVFATGVRNTVGLAFSPVTKTLWFTDNGRDNWGSNKPWDELNHAPAEGMHFGFPFCYGYGEVNGQPENKTGGPDPQFCSEPDCSCANYTGARLEIGPHVAPLGLTFYTGTMFPKAQFYNNIIMALHGSWNRPSGMLSGYEVQLVQMDAEGKYPIGQQTLASGFLNDERTARWARPVDVWTLEDGSILVSDDLNGAIFRISYEG